MIELRLAFAASGGIIGVAAMVEQPSGTVTLVFTDIEGSTRLLRELGRESYREALAEHRRIVRQACSRHTGYEVDYEGDSFFYAFASANDALSAVKEAMRELESGPIRLRVGIHTGEPGLDSPKYVGIDVHLAARIMAAGHGGQVLFSNATRDLVDIESKDLGEHRLKGIPEPVWVYQLGDRAFPPLLSLNNTNLPTPASSFVGREAELAEADHLLAGSRLLTVRGPGGAGKTRFAIELASQQLPRFPNGVFWVPLAALRDPVLVLETVAHAIGAREEVAAHIGARRMLLLLDNFEQVVAAAPELSALASLCPNLSLLVTSRELLRIEGEVDFALPPLARDEGVDLFCTRARCAPSSTVSELCRRLDGLPLAIELAAARLVVLNPEQLLELLAHRLDLLRGGRDADPRQQTLRATIQWSYELLSKREARLFRRLSVFAGGCTLAAATEVAGADLDTLQALVEKSLVRHTDDRFQMLETIRDFALGALGDETEVMRCKHALAYLALAEASKERRGGPEEAAADRRLEAERPNLRAALDWALEADSRVFLRLWLALGHYFVAHGRLHEARAYVQPAVEASAVAGLSLAARVDILGSVFMVYHLLGERAAAAEVAKARMGVAAESGEPGLVSAGLAALAGEAAARGDLRQALNLQSEALQLARQSEDLDLLARRLMGLADVEEKLGNLPACRRASEEAHTIYRQLGDTRRATEALLNIGWVLCWEGDLKAALENYQTALLVLHEYGDAITIGWAMHDLAVVALRQGEIERAARLSAGWKAVHARIGYMPFPEELKAAESQLRTLAARRGEPHVEEAWADGAAMTLDELVTYALEPPP